MSQAPQSGSLQQVTDTLRQVVLSNIFTVEVQAVKAEVSAGGFASVWRDAAGADYSVSTSLIDTTFTDLTWVEESIAKAVVSADYELTPPFPLVVISGKPGSIGMGYEGPMGSLDDSGKGSGFSLRSYTVDVAVFSAHSDPNAAERKAVIQATAVERLVLRNPSLGGLVLSALPQPVEPGGATNAKPGGILGAARVRILVKSLAVI